MPRHSFYISPFCKGENYNQPSLNNGIILPYCDICFDYAFDNTVISGDKVCADCFAENDNGICGGCSKLFWADDLTHWSYEDYCEECLEQVSFVCRCCNRRRNSDFYVEDGLCDDCHEEEEEENASIIRDYEDKPNLPFLGKGPYFMGVELEVELSSSCSHADDAAEYNANYLSRFSIFKEDASLDHGFEIVTFPSSLDKHKENWPEFFKKYKYITVKDTCGMHVHVSRDAVSALDIAKMLYFISKPEHGVFIKGLAGRFNVYHAQNILWSKCAKVALTNQCERYVTLNLRNEDTIEFRLFASTLDEKTFFTRLEFVEALCIMVKTHNVHISLYDFYTFVTKNKKRYPNLYYWLCNNNCPTPLNWLP